MANIIKPRFHDEECYGSAVISGDYKIGAESKVSAAKPSNPSDLIESAQRHIAEKDIKSGVDDIISAYQHLAEEKAKLSTLRNEVFRYLSTARGWQGAPHPQSLRLRRATPSIPVSNNS